MSTGDCGDRLPFAMVQGPGVASVVCTKVLGHSSPRHRAEVACKTADGIELLIVEWARAAAPELNTSRATAPSTFVKGGSPR